MTDHADPIDNEVVTLLEVALEQARLGRLTEVFLWYRTPDADSDYEYLVDDIPDLLYELGNVIITERIDCSPGCPKVPRHH